MKRSFTLLLGFTLLLLGKSVSGQVVLRPSIGLPSLPADNTPICYTPMYSGGYSTSGLMEGDTAKDFTFYDLNGTGYNLATVLAARKPVLLVAGSYTCPVFRGKIPTINNVANLYANDILIFVLYELEAHPNIDTSVYFGYPNPGSANISAGILYRQPTTYGERKVIAQDLLDSLPINAPLLIDGPCNEFYFNYGPAPNNAYLIDTNGIVFSKHGWFHRSPDDIYCDIDSLLGRPTNCGGGTNNGVFQWRLIGSNTVTGPAGNILYAYGQFKNNSAASALIGMKKDIVQLPAGWATSICTDICYPSNVDSASLLLPSQDSMGYTMYFYTDLIPDSGQVRMRFRNVNVPSNGFQQWFKGITTAPVVGTAPVYHTALISVSPNPVKGDARVLVPQELFSAFPEMELRLFDLRGSLQVEKIIRSSSEAILSTSNLPEGVYFVRVTGAGQVLGNCKVLVY